MGKRKRIALIYTMDKGWIGGTYYILNLICSLKLLNENEKIYPRKSLVFAGVLLYTNS